MKRSTILAIMEGQKQRLNESLIFWKATGDIERAGGEFINTEYNSKTYEFEDYTILFDIKAGQTVKPLSTTYKGMDVVTGLEVTTTKKVFVSEITEYDIQKVVRIEIAKEVAKDTGMWTSDWQIDCKLTKLYIAEKLTWEEYCSAIQGGC